MIRFFVALGRTNFNANTRFPGITRSKQHEYVEKFMLLYAPVYSFSLFKFLYSDGVQFLAALKILLKVDRLLNPERRPSPDG